jgi:hypothetical protein
VIGAAGLAGRIKEFDQRDGRIFRAKAGRVRPDKECGVNSRRGCGDRSGLGLALTVQEKGPASEGGKPEG